MSDKIKQHLVEVSKIIYEKGMANAYEGNLSFLEDGRVYITPSGKCKGYLSCEMIAVTDLQGNIMEGQYKPSSELKLHLSAYRNRPEIKSVIHAHTPYATAYALANKPIETRAYPELITFFEKIPLAPYGTPSTDEIYIGMEFLIKDYDVVLLANHGIITVGKDAMDAFFKLEAAESIAKTLFLATQLGGGKDLPQHKLDELHEIRMKSKAKK